MVQKIKKLKKYERYKFIREKLKERYTPEEIAVMPEIQLSTVNHGNAVSVFMSRNEDKYYKQYYIELRKKQNDNDIPDTTLSNSEEKQENDNAGVIKSGKNQENDNATTNFDNDNSTGSATENFDNNQDIIIQLDLESVIPTFPKFVEWIKGHEDHLYYEYWTKIIKGKEKSQVVVNQSILMKSFETQRDMIRDMAKEYTVQ